MSAYEELHFQSLPSPERHIDRLYINASLLGLSAVDPRNARVLDIGCSTADNIIALASWYPKSTFVGLDASESQIEKAQNRVQQLSLSNIELHCCEIGGSESKDLEPLLSEFDYVICHGLYSWGEF